MFNFLIKISMVIMILCSNNLLAMEAYENDIRLSERSFLISDTLYDKKDTSNGAITLCFKEVRNKSGLVEYLHASLVFEMFFPRNPQEIAVRMIHYKGDDDCCGCGKNKRPYIEAQRETLMKVYRGVDTNPETDDRTFIPAIYTRYASWTLPNKDLIEGFTQAKKDADDHNNNNYLYDSYNCIGYIQRIMQSVGLNGVDFGWWIRRADNLKLLVDKHITPNPTKKDYPNIPLGIIEKDVIN